MRLPRRVPRRGRSISVSLLLRTARDHGGVRRLGQDDLRFRPLLHEHAAHPFERPARSKARDEEVESLAGEIGENLLRGRARVHVGISLVFELAREKPSVLFGELDRFLHHARTTRRRWRENDLRAEEAHQATPLDAERLGHRHDERISLGGAHHRESNTRVAARSLDHRLARLELAFTLGVLDYSEREAILPGAEWIEGLA